MEKLFLERRSKDQKKIQTGRVEGAIKPLIPVQEVRSPAEMKEPLGPGAPGE